MLILLVLVPLLTRHIHHFYVTRNAKRRWQRAGLGSAAVWAVSYLILALGALGRTRAGEPGLLWWIGYGLLWGAVIGRVLAIRQLGGAFSELIRVERHQPLVKAGVYAHVRHPLH